MSMMLVFSTVTICYSAALSVYFERVAVVPRAYHRPSAGKLVILINNDWCREQGSSSQHQC